MLMVRHPPIGVSEHYPTITYPNERSRDDTQVTKTPDWRVDGRRVDGGCGDVRLASGAERVARTRKFCPEQSSHSGTESAGRGTVGRRSAEGRQPGTCVGCHNSRATTSATVSGVILDKADLTRVGDSAAIWEKVIKKLRAGAMPPAGMPRPDAATHDCAGLVSRDVARSRGGDASQSRPAIFRTA